MKLYRIHSEDQSDMCEMIGPSGIDLLTLESEFLKTCPLRHETIYHFSEWLREFHSFVPLDTEDYHCNILEA